MLPSDKNERMKHIYKNLWIGKLWDKGDEDGGQFLADHFVDHRPIPQFPNSKAGHIEMAKDWNRAFPDMKFYIEDMVVENNRLVARYIARGTHEGILLGIPGTGAKVELHGIDIFNFDGDYMTDWWHNEDFQSMMETILACHHTSKAS